MKHARTTTGVARARTATGVACGCVRMRVRASVRACLIKSVLGHHFGLQPFQHSRDFVPVLRQLRTRKPHTQSAGTRSSRLPKAGAAGWRLCMQPAGAYSHSRLGVRKHSP
jgi:hypothetical protein